MLKIKLLQRTFIDRVGTCEAGQKVSVTKENAKHLVNVAKLAEWVGDAPEEDELEETPPEDKKPEDEAPEDSDTKSTKK